MTPFVSHEETTQQVKDTADIVEVIGDYVSLKRAGVNYKGLCPFHSEKTPSFTVNPVRKSFHCFGCNEGGDVLAFVMRFHNISFPDALKQLAERYNIAMPEKQLNPKDRALAQEKKNIYRINEEAVSIYHRYLLDDPAAAQARIYLEKRGIPQQVINDFRLGFAPDSWDFLCRQLTGFPTREVEDAGLIVPNDRNGHYDRFRNRILFPIFSANGKPLGFGGRSLGEQMPKYLNSPESPVYNKSKTLFGLFQNKEAIRRSQQCLLVEGNFDLLSLVAKGVANVVAPLGTALTSDQVKVMKGYVQEAIILFDGDKAGVNAALRAVPLFLSAQLPAKVVVLPESHDPDTFIRASGREKFDALISKAQPLPEFVFDRLLNKHGFSLAGKSAIINELKPIIESISDKQLQRSLFLSHFSQKLGLTPEQMVQGMPVPGPGLLRRQPAPRAERQDGNPQVDLTKIEDQILGFLVVYPQYVRQFVEDGVRYAIESSSGKVILQHLTSLAAEDRDFAPEHLMDVTSGPERQFISERLMEVRDIPDQARDDEAAEKRKWLAENARKWQMKELTKKINQAQQDNNEKLLMELLLEKNKMRESGREER